jgi:putative ABC transport system permease protein
MFLALRELTFARARFLMMGSVVSLITVLMVMLSGLSVGLVNDGVSGLQKLPVTGFAFEKGVSKDSAFSRSVVQLDDVQAWKQQPGVDDATPFGNTLVNGHNQKQKPVDLALFGVESDSFMAPEPAQGDALGSKSNQAVVSPTLKDQGVSLGDVITIDRIGTQLTVIGFLPEQATFGHVDVAYTTLDTWQEVKAGTRPGESVPPSARSEVTSIAITGDVDLAAAGKATGTEPMTLKESYGASPGYTAETSTLMLIQVFLYAISALVVGAFFTVWTIQRKKEIAVLRATGAPTSYVLRDSLTQALLLLLGSVAVGLAIGYGLGAMISGTAMPFALEFSAVALAAALLIALGLLGALAAVVRIVRIDPLNALGDQR